MVMTLREKRKTLIVCLTGMPGAGKSTVASALKEKGFAVVTMGDAVRQEAKRQNLDPTDGNLGKLMLKLRQDLGQGAIAHLVLKEIQERNLNEKNIVVDGIRSLPEVEVLKTVGHVRLLAIHALPMVRFRHLKDRGRSDAPASPTAFEERDKRELSVGVSESIALADEVISNNNITIEELKERALAVVQSWLDEIKLQNQKMDTG